MRCRPVVYQRARSCYLNLSEDSKPAIAKRRNQLKSGRSESLNPVVIVMLSQIHGKPIFMFSCDARHGFVTTDKRVLLIAPGILPLCSLRSYTIVDTTVRLSGTPVPLTIRSPRETFPP